MKLYYAKFDPILKSRKTVAELWRWGPSINTLVENLSYGHKALYLHKSLMTKAADASRVSILPFPVFLMRQDSEDHWKTSIGATENKQKEERGKGELGQEEDRWGKEANIGPYPMVRITDFK
ncbi:hypothetical protein CDL15_Pgr017623 [Punica granatum]|uniref:Uncharacterized protein n=1 Tax=Punica granatum TaxID=22663 RepID=A0A218W5L3_PUNGR|nr:hypothetical protein CDL15_Pgr017623 [Punica granatum]